MTDGRNSPRSALNGILCIQLEPNNHAIVLDISDEGLGFHAVYPVTQSGTVRFSFKQQSGGRIEATGEVAWLDSAKKTGGLRFVSMPEASRDEIRKLSAGMAVPMSPSASFAPPPPLLPPSHLPPPSGVSLPPEPQVPAPQAPAGESPLPEPAAGATSPAAATSAGAVVPAFVLFGSNSSYGKFASGRQMRGSPRGSKFFRGFVSGIIVAAILVAIAYIAMGNPARYLRGLVGSYTGAKTAPQAIPAASPAQAAPAASSATPAQQPVPSAALPPATNSQAPADSQPSGDFAAGTSTNPSASPPAPAHTPDPAQQPSAAQSNAAASEISTVELANEDLTRAQRYLNGNGGPGAHTTAASLLWEAVGAGNVKAEVMLAGLYAHGTGVAKNCNQARVLLKAAEQSNGEAPPELSQFIRRGCR